MLKNYEITLLVPVKFNVHARNLEKAANLADLKRNTLAAKHSITDTREVPILCVEEMNSDS